jgi:hypothetical protein
VVSGNSFPEGNHPLTPSALEEGTRGVNLCAESFGVRSQISVQSQHRRWFRSARNTVKTPIFNDIVVLRLNSNVFRYLTAFKIAFHCFQ